MRTLWTARCALPYLAVVGCTSSPTTPFRPEAGVDAFVFKGDATTSMVDATSPFADVSFPDVPFPCGASTCAPGSQYCLHVLAEGGLSPEGGNDVADQCIAVPPACLGMATCACLEPMAPCEAGVEGEGCIQAGGVEITCPSP